MELDSVDHEVVDALVNVVIDLHKLEHTTSLYLTEGHGLAKGDYLAGRDKAIVPHTLPDRGVIGRPGYIVVDVAVRRLNHKPVRWVNGKRGRPLAEKYDARQLSRLLGDIQRALAWPRDANPGNDQ